MKKDNFSGENNIRNYSNDDINLGEVLSFYLRNKKFIGLLTIIGFVISLFYSFNVKKVWEGQFQIVIKTNSSKMNPLSSLNPTLQGLAGIGGNNNSYETEIGILKSPSVLMPVFDFVKSNKIMNDSNSDLIFSNWVKENLGIELIKRSSILNISYKDNDKKIIIPVLEKITTVYQDYSTQNKKRSQLLIKNFLNEQILLYKIRSSKSLKEAQEYAIDQDLLFYNIDQALSFKEPISSSFKLEDNNTSQSIDTSFLPSNNSFEGIRIQAANEIKKIDLQLKAIEEVGNNSKKLQYIASNIPTLLEMGLPKALSDLENKIAQKRLIFTENDQSIKRLITERDLLIQVLKDRTIGFLNGQRTVANARMISAKRPKEVLLRYKELTRKAFRDENTLLNLENRLSVIELEEARQEDPWKLITKPTLLIDEVAPNKKKIVLVGIILGFLVGSGIVSYKEFKKGVIFNKKKLEMECGSSIIDEIKINDIDPNSEKILFLRDFLKYNSCSSLCLLNLDETQNSYFENLIKTLNNLIPEINIIEMRSLVEFNESLTTDMILLVTKIGSIELNKINQLKKRLVMFNKEVSGIILVT